MKRKTTALLLALMMCLLLLSACGANNTPDAEEPPAPVNTSAEQQPADKKEDEPEQEEPKQEEPEKAEEPMQEEPEEVNNAGTEFLALLQEEYENGFFEGEGPVHTYYSLSAPFIYNGVIYIPYSDGDYYVTYDIASKELSEPLALEGYQRGFFLDGNLYIFRENDDKLNMYDCNGALLDSFGGFTSHYKFFDKGFLFYDYSSDTTMVLSYNLEKIAEIPAPQREVEHGLKEDVELLKPESMFAADGTIYAPAKGKDGHLYRLNTDTYEWEDIGNAPTFGDSQIPFFGKYVSGNDGFIYDRVTGEQVFEFGELYSVYSVNGIAANLCYFGGDKYLGYNGSEYRWVNLTDMSMSDPLPFPEVDEMFINILNDTYCVYGDKYGYFLWNYNDGTEETIVMYDN